MKQIETLLLFLYKWKSFQFSLTNLNALSADYKSLQKDTHKG